MEKQRWGCRLPFDRMTTAAFVKGENGVVSMVNSRFVELTGYPKDEIEGKMKWTDFFSERDLPRLERYHDELEAFSDSSQELECELVTEDGRVKEVFLSFALLPGTNKFIGSLIDISILKQTQRALLESKAKLSAIMEAFEGLIYVCNSQYRIEYINERMIKRKGSDIRTEPCFKALHGRDAPCPFCAMERVLAGQAVRFEMKDPRDGRWYYSANTPVRHGDGSVSLLAMITDIDDRKQAEAALKANEERLRRENIILKREIKDRYRFGDLIGKSSAMQSVYDQILHAANTDVNVIVYGEPGTGKELVAKAIHQASPRKDKRFVPVHCGAIPESLFESEFFGYKKGAFSGAYRDRQGYLDYSDGGTLFLDEIGELSLHMQVKLLRAIEGGGYTPVGGNQVKYSDFRIIAATNRDLKDLVQKGLMRQDFFYRIHVLPIQLPPLRDRKEDIPLLADHFLKHCKKKYRDRLPVPGRFYEILHDYDWPGNVRELENAIIRFCAQGHLDFLPTSPTGFADALVAAGGEMKTLKEHVEELEKRIIKKALEKNRWHRSKTALELGIDRKTLSAKIRRYHLLDHK